MKVLLIAVLLAFSGFTFKTECREDVQQEMKVKASCGAWYEVEKQLAPDSGGESVWEDTYCRDCWTYQITWEGIKVIEWTECP